MTPISTQLCITSVPQRITETLHSKITKVIIISVQKQEDTKHMAVTMSNFNLSNSFSGTLTNNLL